MTQTIAAGVRVAARHVRGAGGPPVVMIHGVGLSGRYLIPLARELSDGCDVWVPDLPGYGASERLRRPPTLRFLADALDEWAEQHVGPAIYVGNSFGCQVVTYLAVAHPERVRALVLMSPTVDPNRRGAIQQLGRLGLDAFRERRATRRLALRDAADLGFGHVVQMMLRSRADHIEQRLEAIDVSVLVLRGEHDVLVSDEWERQLTEMLRRGSVGTIQGAAHGLNHSHPASTAAAIRAFLPEALR